MPASTEEHGTRRNRRRRRRKAVTDSGSATRARATACGHTRPRSRAGPPMLTRTRMRASAPHRDAPLRAHAIARARLPMHGFARPRQRQRVPWKVFEQQTVDERDTCILTTHGALSATPDVARETTVSNESGHELGSIAAARPPCEATLRRVPRLVAVSVPFRDPVRAVGGRGRRQGSRGMSPSITRSGTRGFRRWFAGWS